MDFLKEFGKQFSNRARSGERSKDGPEIARLNAELKNAEAELERLYTRFGRASYALMVGEGNPGETEDLAVRVRAKRLEVEELAAARDAARELRQCANCGALFPKEARFCSACGKKLPEAPPRPEPVEAGEYCPVCGAKRENAEPRCPVCGHVYDAETEPEPALEPAVPDDKPAPEEPDEAME